MSTEQNENTASEYEADDRGNVVDFYYPDGDDAGHLDREYELDDSGNAAAYFFDGSDGLKQWAITNGYEEGIKFAFETGNKPSEPGGIREGGGMSDPSPTIRDIGSFWLIGEGDNLHTVRKQTFTAAESPITTAERIIGLLCVEIERLAANTPQNQPPRGNLE